MANEFEIRVEQPSDYSSIERVHEQAFSRKDEGVLVSKIRASESYIPELSFVAVSDGEIVGHVLFSVVHIDAETKKPVLALAPLAVLPEWQKRGVGGQLTRHGLKRSKELGWKAVIVLGQSTYYPRFGFEPAHKFGVECPFPLNDPGAFMAIELEEDALVDSVGTVVYPEFFMQPSIRPRTSRGGVVY